MRRILFCTVLVLFSANVFASNQLKPFSYDDQESETLLEVISNLYTGHVNRQLLDDQTSKQYLHKLLETLDPGKMFFYQADIDGFNKYQLKIDDEFKKGDLDVPFNIYKLCHSRVVSRLQTVIEQLEDPHVKWDFTVDESIAVDRKDASWPKSISEADELWHKRLKLGLLNLKLAGKTVDEARSTLAKRYKNQLNRIKQEDNEDIFETIMNSLTLLYDPHTNYWSAKTAENFDINMSLSLEGIGAVLQSEDEYTKVVRLVPGGPAAKEGELKSSDRIISVGQGVQGEMVDVVGWRLDDVVDLIRGPKNTMVKLEVLPAGKGPGDATKTIKIVRSKVELEDQSAQKAILTLPGTEPNSVRKIGVIDLPAFYVDFEAAARHDPNFRSSTRDVARLLSELERENIDGLIIDLRNNGGGSLQEATMLTDLFIDRGVVVQIKTPDGRVRRDNQAITRPYYTGPLIVLVNRLSASASEIFAGAIQDYGRGLIIGSRTFGKGTVQSLRNLKIGTLKLTDSKFYRVSGASTQHRGVVPDINFPSLVDDSEVGESAYENALPWDSINAVPHVVYQNFSKVLPTLEVMHDNRVKKDPDFIYLNDEVSLLHEDEKQKTVSLNEQTRIQEKQKQDEEALAIENKRRASKGLPVYKTIAEIKSDDDNDIAGSDVAPTHIDVDGDAMLIESGNILCDLITLEQNGTSESVLANQE